MSDAFPILIGAPVHDTGATVPKGGSGCRSLAIAMLEIGYKLSSGAGAPRTRPPRPARRSCGLQLRHDLASLSSVDCRQGQIAFVWAVIGGIAQVTERLKLATAVTCPAVRIHPVIVAQAAHRRRHDAWPFPARGRHRREPSMSTSWGRGGRKRRFYRSGWSKPSGSSGSYGRVGFRATAVATTPSRTR